MFIKFNNQLISIQVISTIEIQDESIVLNFSKLHHPLKRSDDCLVTAEVYESKEESEKRFNELTELLCLGHDVEHDLDIW